MDGTTPIDCSAPVEAMAPQKALTCSSIKVGSPRGAGDARAKSGRGIDWYAMVTIALLLKILTFQRDI
jgi:hypothetical protein